MCAGLLNAPFVWPWQVLQLWRHRILNELTTNNLLFTSIGCINGIYVRVFLSVLKATITIRNWFELVRLFELGKKIDRRFLWCLKNQWPKMHTFSMEMSQLNAFTFLGKADHFNISKQKSWFWAHAQRTPNKSHSEFSVYLHTNCWPIFRKLNGFCLVH